VAVLKNPALFAKEQAARKEEEKKKY